MVVEIYKYFSATFCLYIQGRINYNFWQSLAMSVDIHRLQNTSVAQNYPNLFRTIKKQIPSSIYGKACPLVIRNKEVYEKLE
jgi:type IV secretory pathway component VirB8